MKNEYDFSQAERGKFYRSDAELNLPVYLDRENLCFIQNLAERQNSDLSTVVNELIRSKRQLAEAVD